MSFPNLIFTDEGKSLQLKAMNGDSITFTKVEKKYSYMELSKLLNRTTGAIQRRIFDLGCKDRPIKQNNHVKWTDDEWCILADMIKNGFRYEEI